MPLVLEAEVCRFTFMGLPNSKLELNAENEGATPARCRAGFQGFRPTGDKQCGTRSGTQQSRARANPGLRLRRHLGFRSLQMHGDLKLRLPETPEADSTDCRFW